MIDKVAFVQSLSIKNVEQKWVDNEAVRLSFEVNGVNYYLYVENCAEQVYLPNFIAHGKNQEKCPVCGKRATEYLYCEGLSYYKNELFAYLKTCNAIRLEWLFLT